MDEFLIVFVSHDGVEKQSWYDSYSTMVIGLAEIMVDPTIAHWRMYEIKVSGYKAADWNHN